MRVPSGDASSSSSASSTAVTPRLVGATAAIPATAASGGHPPPPAATGATVVASTSRPATATAAARQAAAEAAERDVARPASRTVNWTPIRPASNRPSRAQPGAATPENMHRPRSPPPPKSQALTDHPPIHTK